MADLGVHPGIAVSSQPLAAVDAQTYWMSARIPSDQFLLYVFDGVLEAADTVAVVAGLRERALACPDLQLRVDDGNRWRYPRWVPAPVQDNAFRVHDAELDWPACLDAVAALAEDQLDARESAWRLHLFAPVTGVPTATGVATVAVVQICHTLADGTRTAELGGWLLGREQPVAPIPAARRANLLMAGIAAGRAHRDLVAAIAAGDITAAPPPRPPLPINACAPGPRRIRTLICDRATLAGRRTVTVAALEAIGTALADYLSARDIDPAPLAAEVPLRKSGPRPARNHFRNVGIGLHPGLPRAERDVRIAAELAAARRRADHAAAAAEDRALAAVPAPLLRWGTERFDPTARPPAVTGHTVVSSVNRGPKDLLLGGLPVLFTAGYPALSPMMGLTHGVHGLGDTVALSVHAAAGVDLDDYLPRLALAVASA